MIVWLVVTAPVWLITIWLHEILAPSF